jgi:putative transposase
MGNASKYGAEFRRRAVEEVLDRDRSVPEVTRELGIGSAQTLRNWVNKEKARRSGERQPTSDELTVIKALRKEVADQQRTIEILKAATTFFPTGDRSSFEMKAAFVDAFHHRWPTVAICDAIELRERSYYAHKARPASKRSTSDRTHKVEIMRVFNDNYRCYGAYRIHRHLNREGYRIARCTVERLMPVLGIRGVMRGRRPYTTIPDGLAARPPDLVDRDFTAIRPHELWLADITYVSTWQGWLYVAFILDVFSRRIVGYQIADHLRTELATDALEMALWRRQRDEGTEPLIHHSDAGSQLRFKGSLQHCRVGPSVGSHQGPRRVSSIRWPKRSTGRSKPNSSHSTAPGRLATRPRSRSSNGSTGTTTSDSTDRSEISHPPRNTPTTTVTGNQPHTPGPNNPHCTNPGGPHDRRWSDGGVRGCHRRGLD